MLCSRVNLKSDEFETHLQPFLGDKTSHFMHELVSFAESPFDIIAYDGKVKYDWPPNYPVPIGHADIRTEVGVAASSGQASSNSSATEATEGMYVRMYICMYVCMYVCTYVYMYVCMYVCIGIFLLFMVVEALTSELDNFQPLQWQ